MTVNAINEPLGIVNHILKKSFVDGPGNRAVIFLQGCNFALPVLPQSLHHQPVHGLRAVRGKLPAARPDDGKRQNILERGHLRGMRRVHPRLPRIRFAAHAHLYT